MKHNHQHEHTSEACPTCYGKGTLNCPACGGYGSFTCRGCNGSGYQAMCNAAVAMAAEKIAARAVTAMEPSPVAGAVAAAG